MKKIFEEYGGVITTAMAIVALIGVIGLLFNPTGTGWMDGAFKGVINGFTDKVENAVPGNSGAIPGSSGGAEDAALEGDGQTFYTLAPSTLTFGSKAPRGEFEAIKINGATLDPAHYTVTDAEPGTNVTLSLDYLKTLDATTYSIEVVSANIAPAGTFAVVEPGKNEHGFYYNQPYTAYVSALDGEYVFFLRDDNTMDVMLLDNAYTEVCSYTVDGKTITVDSSMGTFEGTVSDDGSEIFVTAFATAFKLGDENIAADDDYIYVYKDSLGGYEVVCIDKTKASYGAIRTGINGKPTVALTEYMFAGNDNLIVAPSIPDSVTTIESQAFYGCENLYRITIPDSVTNIGFNAFSGCTGLTDIAIPDGVVSIGEQAFDGCTSLTSITIPEGVTNIGSYTFCGCTSLERVNIPDSVTSIGDHAFMDCKNLTDITFEGTVDQWNAITKGSNWKLNVPATQVVCTDGTVSLA